jgi:hypothetical protein
VILVPWRQQRTTSIACPDVARLPLTWWITLGTVASAENLIKIDPESDGFGSEGIRMDPHEVRFHDDHDVP